MKETLKEAAKKHSDIAYNRQDYEEQFYNPIGCIKYASFIEGAKWQEQKMYSEEDMRGMYDKSCGLFGLELLDDQTENDNRFKEILEQFKKK